MSRSTDDAELAAGPHAPEEGSPSRYGYDGPTVGRASARKALTAANVHRVKCLTVVSSSTASALTRFAAALLRVRWFVRLPIWLYRARLGFLFGTRFLMLEHVGRKSGLRRFVVLEVIDRPAPGRYVVTSGFGERAQWLRNIMANPRVRVSIGGHATMPARAQRLDPDAAATSLSRYASEHPRSWASLRPVLEQTLGAPIDECGTVLPLIAFDTTAVTLSPVRMTDPL